MEVELAETTENHINSSTIENGVHNESLANFDDLPLEIINIINKLVGNDNILYKSQQRNEEDITKEEKMTILKDIFNKSKSNFLSRYGQFLTAEQLQFFERFKNDPKDGYEIMFHLKNISKIDSKKKKHRHLRNKRFAALKRLEKGSYFSENEMMKRNPLLYEQLVGQYLSSTEKKFRDRQNYREEKTFVSVLMDGIEKEQMEKKRKEQEEAEDVQVDESDEDVDDSEDDMSTNQQPSTSKCEPENKIQRTLWGEMPEDGIKLARLEQKGSDCFITAQERRLLREEFVSVMYQNFLDGKDEEFDYDAVDNNDDYDNLEILEHDEEEKYFDSEEPEDTIMEDEDTRKKEDSSEDELDIYMSALNQHPAVCQLSEDIKKL